jgi:hypothetical protein
MDLIENYASNSLIVACIHYHSNMFMELLPSTKRRDTFNQAVVLQQWEAYTYRHPDWWEGFMKYAVEMGWGAMVYIASFIKIGSGIQSWWVGHTDKMEIA